MDQRHWGWWWWWSHRGRKEWKMVRDNEEKCSLCQQWPSHLFRIFHSMFFFSLDTFYIYICIIFFLCCDLKIFCWFFFFVFCHPLFTQKWQVQTQWWTFTFGTTVYRTVGQHKNCLKLFKNLKKNRGALDFRYQWNETTPKVFQILEQFEVFTVVQVCLLTFL